jgi:Cu2+-exporting ATPase
LREALLAEGLAENLDPLPGTLREEVGHGLVWFNERDEWRLGRPEWTSMGDGPDRQWGEARTILARNGKALLGFTVRDDVRAGAPEEVGALGVMGYSVFVLSGDRRSSVKKMVSRLGLPADRGLAEQTPDEKAAWIRERGAETTLMIGDGANDSLAFDAAGCRGTPAVDRGLLEQKADFFFLGRSLSGIRLLMETARRHGRVALAIMAFAVLYNIVAVALCLAGWMNPLLAAVLMPLSAIVSLAMAAYGMRRRDR